MAEKAEAPASKVERPRDESGKFVQTPEEIRAAAVAEMEKNPNFFLSIIEGIKSSPVLGKMAEQNIHASKMAAKGKAGDLLLSRIRKNLVVPALPEQYAGIFDSPLISGVFDLAVGNLILFLGAHFQEKLPIKLQPYAMMMGECATYAAWNRTFGSIDIEGTFLKLASGDLLDTFKGLVEQKAA